MEQQDELRDSILDWDEDEVHLFFTKLGYPQYEKQIKEHRISGEILSVIDADGLKEVGVSTIGQRLAILRATYLAKLSHNVPISRDSYIPPSEMDEFQEAMTVDRLSEIVRSQGERLRTVEEENRRLNELMQYCMDEILRASAQDHVIQNKQSFKWDQFSKPTRSPTKPEHVAHIESPHPSPQKSEHDMSRTGLPPPSLQQPLSSSNTNSQRLHNNNNSSGESSGSAQQSSSGSRQDAGNLSTSSDNLKSFKVSLDDPAWKVLPAALKKYKINNDDWQNYAMFICYGSTERCLSFDEKPLLLFQKLKDAKKNPVFMLKHIKDIRSPIVVAQQKQAARKASGSSNNTEASPSTTTRPPVSHGHARSGSLRPPKLQMHGLTPTIGSSPLTTTSITTQNAWPEVTSPNAEKHERTEEFMVDRSKMTINTTVNGSIDDAPDVASSSVPKDAPVASASVSYAVAIYPYMAEQDDEFNVVVGDTFVILSRARGWWVVQRDPTGSGVVEPDTSKQGWVPAGCLLETNVPVSSAVAEANASRSQGANSSSPPASPASKTPILPLSILSTSFPGIALMDYRKKGEEELNLRKDDLLRVFKRYNHWSYAVKEESGDRGWVPSWFVGKVSNNGAIPATPSNATAPHTAASQVTLDSDLRYASEPSITIGQQSQVSPMSSAFPVQTR